MAPSLITPAKPKLLLITAVFSLKSMKGNPTQNRINYHLEDGPLVVQASPARWGFQEPICISVPAGSGVRGCIWLQWKFSEDSFDAFVHFTMGDLWAHLPTPCWVFSSFWPKMAWPPCLIPLFTRSHLKWLLFLFPQMKKSSKGNFLLSWKR